MISHETFLQHYQEKLRTPQEIAAQIQCGHQVYTDIALSHPKAILDAIGERAERGELYDVTINTMLDLYPEPCYKPELAGRLRGISWFSGEYSRKAVNGGYADIQPCYYRDIPQIIREDRQVDVLCVAVSPMDTHGYFSMGAVGSYVENMLEKAKYVFLEVNHNLPRSLSAPVIHLSQVTALCENTIPLPCKPPSKITEVSATIGKYIAEEIPDGSTLQLGIGSIPDAVGMALKEKHNLGIHTELFLDSMVELIECGAVDNSRKPVHRWRSVATFAYGSQKVYDYINDNRAIMILPVDIVNNPSIIAQHPNFQSINSALEVDFYGQVCAEAIGSYHMSGTGGQVDFVRGSLLSPGGHSYIAFSSTCKGGTVSRIVPTLTPGAIVTTSKNDVDNIVTEYGIARLRGRTLSQRTKALISIAHPKFRDELTYAAKKQNILI